MVDAKEWIRLIFGLFPRQGDGCPPPMRILHVTKRYPWARGGDATAVYNLRRCQKANHEVFVLTPNCEAIEDAIKVGPPIEDLDRITVGRLLALFFLLGWGFRRLRDMRPDIIHSHSADLGFFISIPAHLYHIPIVNTCHGVSFPYPYGGRVKRSAERWLLKHGGFSNIITVDWGSMGALEREGLKVTYVPNGIDLKAFGKKTNRVKGRSIEGTNVGKAFRFLFVGRLEEQKGLRCLMEAVSRIRGDFKLSVVGDGSQMGFVRRWARGDGGVEVMGPVDDRRLLQLYGECDALVLPSVWEGFPLVILEAWASGLPVIASSVGSVPTICTDGTDALLVEPNDAKGLAQAMRRLMVDEELRYALAKGGLSTVKGYDWGKVARLTERVYRGV